MKKESLVGLLKKLENVNLSVGNAYTELANAISYKKLLVVKNTIMKDFVLVVPREKFKNEDAIERYWYSVRPTVADPYEDIEGVWFDFLKKISVAYLSTTDDDFFMDRYMQIALMQQKSIVLWIE